MSWRRWDSFGHFSTISVNSGPIQFGRRIPLIVGGAWQSAWLFVFAAAGTSVNPTDNKNIGICTRSSLESPFRTLMLFSSDDRLSLPVHPRLCHDLGSVRPPFHRDLHT